VQQFFALRHGEAALRQGLFGVSGALMQSRIFRFKQGDASLQFRFIHKNAPGKIIVFPIKITALVAECKF